MNLFLTVVISLLTSAAHRAGAGELPLPGYLVCKVIQELPLRVVLVPRPCAFLFSSFEPATLFRSHCSSSLHRTQGLWFFDPKPES